MPRRIAEGQSQEYKASVRASASLNVKLEPGETFWKSKAKFLLEHHYLLRPRYREGWNPSWLQPDGLDLDPMSCEDWIRLGPNASIIDATDTETGKTVCIKRVRVVSDKGSHERQILEKFEKLRQHSNNHCVPLLKHLRDDDDPQLEYLVMPLLRIVDKPAFETVDNVLDFVTQLLEGLVFMHSHNVAHRDCEYQNLMMDANALFPSGFHPVRTTFDPAYERVLTPESRTTHSVKYYFIDFGLAVDIPPPVNVNKYVVGVFGRDETVPELSMTKPYDAFKVDIYILGNMFGNILYDRYSNLDFLFPLIDMMTAVEPSKRPDAATTEAYWKDFLMKSSIQRADSLIRRPEGQRAKRRRLTSMGTVETPGGILGFAVTLGRRVFEWLTDSQG